MSVPAAEEQAETTEVDESISEVEDASDSQVSPQLEEKENSHFDPPVLSPRSRHAPPSKPLPPTPPALSPRSGGSPSGSSFVSLNSSFALRSPIRHISRKQSQSTPA